MNDFSYILAGLTLGLVGSTHCLGMCGGISAALASGLDKDASLYQRMSRIGLFNVARIISYSLMALCLGLLTQIIQSWHHDFSFIIRLFSASLLILMGLYVMNISRILLHLEQLGQHLWRKIQPLSQRFIPVNSNKKAVFLGFLWGYLPCGLVYSSLAWAASVGNAYESALAMASFGLGTLPAMFITGLSAQKLQTFLNQKQLKWAMGLLIIAYGIWTLMGALPHSGHAQHGATETGHKQHQHH